MEELPEQALVEQVLVRNPTLAQMVAAWRAASARYPLVTSLEDSMLAGTIGPGTIALDDPGIKFAWRLEVSQKLPYPGKRKLRGDNALAEASAAGHDVVDTRLQLIGSARMAYYDNYLVECGLEVNEQSLALLRKFRDSARGRYENRTAPEQDVLQADVEIGREQDLRLDLEETRRIVVARLNTLLHLAPDTPLPPPARQVNVADGLPDAPALRAAALARRPDLNALADHIRAGEASLGLAHKEFYPDFEPFFMYDRFVGNNEASKDLASMLGLRVNLPVYRARHAGAVAEAEARIAQCRAELARQADQVRFQVQQAYAQVQRSERSVRLYEETILRKARLNVEAALSAYITGRVPLLSLVEAERNLVMLQDSYDEAVADYFRRRATLEHVVGGPVVPEPPTPGRSCNVAQ
jgi:outer membrane protein TolC